MAAKFYKKDGNIIIEGIFADKLSINPTNFDWQINNGIYHVRDGIQNKSYELGIFSNVTDESGVVYASAEDLETVLNTATNLTTAGSGGGGGDASSSNQVLQINEATETNTKLDGLKELIKNPSFNVLASLGKISGVSPILKFGENAEIDTGSAPEDIWSFGGEINYSTTNDIDSISSDNNTDNQDVIIVGQTTDGVEVVQTVTLAGQSRVSLTTPLNVVYRAYNNSDTRVLGTVYIYVNTSISGGVPTDTTKIRGGFTTVAQQTEMAIYRVPAGKTLVYLAGFIAVSRDRAGSATVVMKIRKQGGVFLVKRRIGLNSQGSGAWSYPYKVPRVLQEKTDIKFTVTEVSINNMAISGGFEGFLFDNAIWNL